jgi:hypothetical protein
LKIVAKNPKKDVVYLGVFFGLLFMGRGETEIKKNALAKVSEKDIKQVSKYLLTEKKQSRRGKGMRNEKKFLPCIL